MWARLDQGGGELSLALVLLIESSIGRSSYVATPRACAKKRCSPGRKKLLQSVVDEFFVTGGSPPSGWAPRAGQIGCDSRCAGSEGWSGVKDCAPLWVKRCPVGNYTLRDPCGAVAWTVERVGGEQAVREGIACKRPME